MYSRMIKNTKETPAALINNSIDDYINTLIKTKKHVEQHGANFYHFLQPTIFTKNKLNDYETNVNQKRGAFCSNIFC